MLHPTHRTPGVICQHPDTEPCVPTRTVDIVGDIIAYENGDLSALGTLELFSILIRTGQVWSLQGSYGRAAIAFLDEGLIDGDGTITDLAHDRLAALDEEQ